MKKTPIQKAEEYLQKAKGILANTPLIDEFDDPLYVDYADVKNTKKAGRTAWKGCSIALNYALGESIETYDLRTYEERTNQIDRGLKGVFYSAYCMLVYSMCGDGAHDKFTCDHALEVAEQLIDMCKNIQSIIERGEEEKRDKEERLKKFNSTKREDRRIVKRQSKELFELLLDKTGTKRKDLIEIAFQEFVCDNIYLLTPEEKKRFDHLVF